MSGLDSGRKNGAKTKKREKAREMKNSQRGNGILFTLGLVARKLAKCQKMERRKISTRNKKRLPKTQDHRPFKLYLFITSGGSGERRVKKEDRVSETPSVTGEPVGGGGGHYQRRKKTTGVVAQASVRRVRWVRKATRGWREGVVRSMSPLDHTAATALPPPQSLPLRRMLCSPEIDYSRRSRLSREGNACGGACHRGAPGREGVGLRYCRDLEQLFSPPGRAGIYGRIPNRWPPSTLYFSPSLYLLPLPNSSRIPTLLRRASDNFPPLPRVSSLPETSLSSKPTVNSLSSNRPCESKTDDFTSKVTACRS